MNNKITVYEKPTCTKCREVNKILQESGFDYDKINYYIKPLTSTKLSDLALLSSAVRKQYWADR